MQPDRTQPDEIVITGRVVDEAGSPVEGAVAEVVPSQGSSLGSSRLALRISGTELEPMSWLPGPVPTDADGEFVLPIRADQTRRFRRNCDLSLQVSRDGAPSKIASLGRLTESGNCEPGDAQKLLWRLDLPTATLPAGTELAVRVLDASGEPAAGAWVRSEEVRSEAVRSPTDSAWQLAPGMVQADEDGSARILRPADRPTSVSAFLLQTSPTGAEAAANERDITLSETEVEIRSRRHLFVRSLPARTFRDDDLHLLDLGAPRAKFDPEAGPSIFGRVLGEAGEPLAGAVVQLLDPQTRLLPEDGSGLALTPDDGTFQLTIQNFPNRFGRPGEEVSPQLHVAAVGHVGRTLYDVSANVDAGGAQLAPPLEVALKRDLQIAGTVRNVEGDPVPNAMVAVSEQGIPGLGEVRVHTAADGAFVFEGVEPEPAGRSVAVIHAEYVGLEVPLSELPNPPLGLELVIERSVPLRGRVVDSKDNPLDGVTVQKYTPEEDQGVVAMYLGGTVSGAEGVVQPLGPAGGRP